MLKHIVKATGCGLVALILATPTFARANTAYAWTQYSGLMCKEGTGGPSLTINNGDIQNTTTTGAYLYCPLPNEAISLMGMESGDGGPALCTQIYGVNVDLWCTKYEGSYVWGCYSYEGGVTCGGETYCTTSGSGAANLELPYYVFSEDMAYDYNTVEVLLGGSPGTGNYSDMWGYTITYQN